MKALMRSVLPAACAALVTASPITTSAQVDQATAAPTAPAAPAAPAAAPAAAETSFDLGAALREGGMPLSPDDAARKAVASSPDAERARAATEQARASASQAFVAVYPRLDLEASYTRLSDHAPRGMGEINGTITPPGGGEPADLMAEVTMGDSIDDVMALTARLTYPVSDLFFSVLPRYQAANKLAELQKVREIAHNQTVALQAKQAYYEYARARAVLLIAQAALGQNEAQRRDVEALVRGGALARVEQMRADAAVAAARVAVARAEGSVAVTLTALRSLMHEQGDAAFAVTEDLTQALPPLTETKGRLLEAARANRSELKALRGMASVHEKSITAEQGGKLPQLVLQGQYDFANPNTRVAPLDKKFISSWQVGAALRWSPNDFATADARVDRARAERVSTEGDLRVLEDALVTEVSQAYEDYVAAQEATTQAQSGIAAAEETYRVRREQFRAGSVVATEVIQAETELRRARLELVSAAIDARIAAARIARAIEAK
jgi:outer membrane protein TolC